MSLQDALERFERRFYAWALEEFHREIDHGFPFLKRVADPIPMSLISIMKRLDRERQRRLASTLVRSNRVWITTNMPKEWTPEDDKILAWYGEQQRGPTAEQIQFNGDLTAGKIRLCDRKILMRASVRELSKLFPDKPPTGWPDQKRFWTKVNGYDLYTVLLRGRRSWQIAYYHQLRREDIGFEVNHISLLSWLGLGSLTYWWNVTDTGVEAAVAALRDLCRHFVEAAHELLRD